MEGLPTPSGPYDSEARRQMDVEAAVSLHPHLPPSLIPTHVTIMVMGESGLGKTTLVHNLVRSYCSSPEGTSATNSSGNSFGHDGSKTSLAAFRSDPGQLCYQLEKMTVDRVGRQLHIKIQDAPGWGDDFNFTTYLQTMVEFVLKCRERDHNERLGYFPEHPAAHRGELENAITAILYFLPPHRTKPADWILLAVLSQLVAVIPIIAKADTMTADELEVYREEILQVVQRGGVHIQGSADGGTSTAQAAAAPTLSSQQLGEGDIARALLGNPSKTLPATPRTPQTPTPGPASPAAAAAAAAGAGSKLGQSRAVNESLSRTSPGSGLERTVVRRGAGQEGLQVQTAAAAAAAGELAAYDTAPAGAAAATAAGGVAMAAAGGPGAGARGGTGPTRAVNVSVTPLSPGRATAPGSNTTSSSSPISSGSSSPRRGEAVRVVPAAAAGGGLAAQHVHGGAADGREVATAAGVEGPVGVHATALKAGLRPAATATTAAAVQPTGNSVGSQGGRGGSSRAGDHPQQQQQQQEVAPLPISIFTFRDSELAKLGVTKRLPPFAVVCSNVFDDDSGAPVRRYLWGSCLPMDRHHSDLILLKQLLFGHKTTGLWDLLDDAWGRALGFKREYAECEGRLEEMVRRVVEPVSSLLQSTAPDQVNKAAIASLQQQLSQAQSSFKELLTGVRKEHRRKVEELQARLATAQQALSQTEKQKRELEKELQEAAALKAAKKRLGFLPRS